MPWDDFETGSREGLEAAAVGGVEGIIPGEYVGRFRPVAAGMAPCGPPICGEATTGAASGVPGGAAAPAQTDRALPRLGA